MLEIGPGPERTRFGLEKAVLNEALRSGEGLSSGGNSTPLREGERFGWAMVLKSPTGERFSSENGKKKEALHFLGGGRGGEIRWEGKRFVWKSVLARSVQKEALHSREALPAEKAVLNEALRSGRHKF